MDDTEQLVAQYLASKGYVDVLYEPDGNAPPDFLVNGSIAVEVRRLNQHFESGGKVKGLEEVFVPLWDSMEKLLLELGPPTHGASWFVAFRFNRPLKPWKKLRKLIRSALVNFRDAPVHSKASICIDDNFGLEVFAASAAHPTFFVLGGASDRDAGGWVLHELAINLQRCIIEKTAKISKVRAKYPEWWLVVVDHIDFATGDDDRETFREKITISHNWQKVILISPQDPARAFEVPSATP